MSGSQLPWKELGPTHACIRSRDRWCVSLCTHTLLCLSEANSWLENLLHFAGFQPHLRNCSTYIIGQLNGKWSSQSLDHSYTLFYINTKMKKPGLHWGSHYRQLLEGAGMVDLRGCSLAAGWRVPCSHMDRRGAALSQLIQTKLKLSHKEECLQRCSWRGSGRLIRGLLCSSGCVEDTYFSLFSVVCSYESSGFHHALVSKRCANMLFISSPDCLVYWQRGDKFLLAGIYSGLSRITSNPRDTCCTCSYTRRTKKEQAIFFLSVCDSSSSQSACGLCRAVLW